MYKQHFFEDFRATVDRAVAHFPKAQKRLLAERKAEKVWNATLWPSRGQGLRHPDVLGKITEAFLKHPEESPPIDVGVPQPYGSRLFYLPDPDLKELYFWAVQLLGDDEEDALRKLREYVDTADTSFKRHSEVEKRYKKAAAKKEAYFNKWFNRVYSALANEEEYARKKLEKKFGVLTWANIEARFQAYVLAARDEEVKLASEAEDPDYLAESTFPVVYGGSDAGPWSAPASEILPDLYV